MWGGVELGRILITPRSLTSVPAPELELLRDHGHELVFCEPGRLPDTDTLNRLLPGCIGWLAGVEPVAPAVIEQADCLRVISRNGTGVDNLPLPALAARGIRVVRAEGANAQGVAELTLGLALAGMRAVCAEDRGIKEGRWPRHRGIEIAGRVVGVLGCGAVGGLVAQAFSSLGATVMAYDPAKPAISLPKGVLIWAEPDEIFAKATLISLHCPPDPAGAVVSAARLARMPPGAVIVNTARASLVDEAAIIEALECGRLRAYAADVFADEPPGESSLAFNAGVIATSHTGGLTDESISRATKAAVIGLLDALQADAVH